VTQPDWEPLRALLAGSQRILLIAHVSPDADALGSSLALALALRADRRDVSVSVGTPDFRVPRALSWLPGAQTIVAPADIDGPFDAVVALDCASADRLGVLLPVAQQAGPRFAVIDHHRSNPGFAAINIVDPEAPATGTMIADLLDSVDLPWADGVAENIYAAVSSDTGSFRFPATNATTHRLAARLLEQGVDHSGIAQRLFSARPLAVVRLSADVVSRAEFDPAGAGGAGAVFATLSVQDRHRYAVAYDDVESVIVDLAAIADADVVALVKQDDDGGWKVSMRSKGGTDVGAVASDLGGGGHTQAAGFTASVDSAEAVVAHVRAMVSDPRFRRR
jgi:bifunctional oligoribonuclease and PAP phosphatase NrnA